MYIMSVGLSVNSGEMAEVINMPFGMVGWVSPRNHVLDGVQMPPGEGQISRETVWNNVTYKENVTRSLPKLLCNFLHAGFALLNFHLDFSQLVQKITLWQVLQVKCPSCCST